MHSGVIKHHSDGCGPHSCWWSDMKRSAWGSKGSLDGSSSVIRNHKTISLVWTFDRGASRWGWCLRYTSTYVKTVHYASLFSCECSIALEETRVKKSETFCFKHQQLWVRQLHIFLFSYLDCGQRNNSILMLCTNSDTWTKQRYALTQTLFLTDLSSQPEDQSFTVLCRRKSYIYFTEKPKGFPCFDILSLLLRKFCIYYKWLINIIYI